MGTSVAPVFFISTEEKLTTFSVCQAAETASNGEGIRGAQLIGQLWRVYPMSTVARMTLLSKGLDIRGRRIELMGRNPFLLRDGTDREIETTKLFVGNVPISYSNTEISKALKKAGINDLSNLKMERVRDPKGELTNWVTGRRYLWIEKPSTPLPKTLEVGLFTASLFHREMIQKREEIECRRCLQVGHRKFECRNEEVCRGCKKPGHRVAQCKANGCDEMGEAETAEGEKEIELSAGVDSNQPLERDEEVLVREPMEKETENSHVDEEGATREIESGSPMEESEKEEEMVGETNAWKVQEKKKKSNKKGQKNSGTDGKDFHEKRERGRTMLREARDGGNNLLRFFSSTRSPSTRSASRKRNASAESAEGSKAQRSRTDEVKDNEGME